MITLGQYTKIGIGTNQSILADVEHAKSQNGLLGEMVFRIGGDPQVQRR